MSAGVSARGAAEAAVEMHALDPEPEHPEIGKTRVEVGLRIALQIPRLSARQSD